MMVCVNGRFVAEDQAVVSVFDRGFLYGDGLFETMRVRRGIPFRWAEHMQRLAHGARMLRLQLPCSTEQLLQYAQELVRQNGMPDCLLRLTLSRGVGPRGYSPKGADHPSLVMSLHPAPADNTSEVPEWRVITSSVRIPANEALSEAKTCNKLPQIMARAEADEAGVQEALLLNTKGEFTEAASSNLFWIQRKVVCTPPLAAGALPGVTRGLILEICQRENIAWREAVAKDEDLFDMEGVFLSLSSFGIVAVTELDGRSLAQSALVARLHAAYHALLAENG